MSIQAKSASELDSRETARFIVDLFHRLIIHHGLWFAEVKHQVGMEKALEMLQSASKTSFDIQMKHLAKLLGFTMEEGIPSFLLEMDDETLNELKDRMAKNWLVNDGVWFQTIEFAAGMNDAKRCNDSCWAHFSPFEAWSIRRFLDLPPNAGLEGLKKALGFRLYATLNRQSIVDESPTSFMFQMNDCRVQSARKRKGLDDYPCKSAGVVEYPGFAESIDPRIKTECVGCPPDAHPDEWYCAWRFSIEG